MTPPQLIVLNGPPGCGKSTLAQRYVDEHPLALNLDIDHIRAMLGQWQHNPYPAGLLARGIALAAARTHLHAGRDVVIPQFLGRLPFLVEIDRLASETGARFHEIVLMDTKENALRRYAQRPHQKTLHQRVGNAELSTMYDQLLEVIATRPAAKIVPTDAGEVERAYRDFRTALQS